MKTLFGLLLACLVTGSAFAQDQSGKNFQKSFDPQGSENIIFKLPHHGIEARPHDGSTLVVELVVEANVPERIMEGLIKAGRYQLEGGKDGGNFVIDAPGLSKAVTISGKPLEEKVTIAMKTPGAYAVNGNVVNKDVAGRSLNKMSAEQIAKFKAINQTIEVTNIRFISTYKEEEFKKAGLGEPDKVMYGGTPLITVEWDEPQME